MKKWVVFILLLITAAGTLLPCCGADDCCVAQLADGTNHDRHQTEGTCSPFFACAACPGFAPLAKSIQLLKPVVERHVHPDRVFAFTLSSYATSFWQPPRS